MINITPRLQMYCEVKTYSINSRKLGVAHCFTIS